MDHSTSMTARGGAVSLGLLLLAGVAPADDIATLVRRAGEYGKEVSRIEASGRTASLEELLRRGDELAAELKPVIEQLSDQDYASVESDMKGYVVNREEVILVEPDVRFFSKLAGERGTPQDRLYFDYMLKVRPEGFWPAYLRRQTDVGGCVDFGSGLLSTLYKEGIAILPKLTGYYRIQLERMIDDVAHQVTAGTCACGKISSVKKELRLFHEMNPKAPVAGAVRSRMKAIERGAHGVTQDCVGGT